MGQEPTQEPTQEAKQAGGIDYDKLASILDGRQKATEESVLKGYFKEQGLTGDEMAEAIKSFKDARRQKEPDVDGMRQSIAELEAKIAAAEKAATVAKVDNAVIVEAAKMGIDPKAIPYLTRMADLSDVGDGKGGIDASKVASALSKVLDDLPALKPAAESQKGFRIGGEGGKEGKPKALDSKLDKAFGLI